MLKKGKTITETRQEEADGVDKPAYEPVSGEPGPGAVVRSRTPALQASARGPAALAALFFNSMCSCRWPPPVVSLVIRCLSCYPMPTFLEASGAADVVFEQKHAPGMLNMRKCKNSAQK